ncbi:restriction endonuclease subunit S [Bacteroides stercoris]|jgi:type I restriction enzyme S subunit|uniref:Restriction endonuclease subunit S n=1 Tax=Bacteroides stercoris TaxID=46506 RepID=A0A413ZSN1_BACSE|nr:restriction endonuclease subunit S [Bacteroides stercoris]RHC30732.1 restriction endonuclease subunit S [Bacteroides stercoris]
MSNIKKLLEGVEVEWKTLGEITNILRGKRLTRNLLSANDKYPVFHGGLDPLGYYYNANRPADTVMIINVGASAGTVGYSSVDFWSSDGTYCIEQMAKLNNKFLYYFLLGEQYYLKSRVRVAGIPTLDAFVIEKLQIPIPYPNNLKKSLEIQQEIVRILDSFSMLTAELQARKSQYEYYRNQLLAYPMEESDQSSLRSNRSATSIQNSDNSIQPLSTLNPPTGNSVLQPRGKVEWKVLEEVVEIKRGKRLIKNQLEKTGKYAVYQNCMIPLGYYHKNNVIADTTFIISAGSAGEIGYSDVDFWAADDVYYFVTKNDLKSRFLYHFLITQQQKIYSQVRRSSVPRLSKTAFEKLLIPIPSLEEQEHIVSILDKFDALTTSLTEGLPKEIELRQKQYEYYRNMLLSFPKNNIKLVWDKH